MISKVPVAQGDLLFEARGQVQTCTTSAVHTRKEPPLHIVAEDVGNEARMLVKVLQSMLATDVHRRRGLQARTAIMQGSRCLMPC